MELQARADRLARLIEEKLDVRGTGLEAKVHRAGRLLPRYVREDAGYIVRALQMSQTPKLARQVDERRLRRAFKSCERYLRAINEWERRWAITVSWLATNAFSFLAVVALIIGVLVWRGFV